MPAFNSTITTLSLLPSRAPPSHHHGHPTERDINRIALLDIAPDREALLMSNKSIEEIRQTLKIRTGSVNGHWLYRIQRQQGVKVRDPTTRMSAFMHADPSGSGATPEPDENAPTQSNIHVVRRVLSASSVYPLTPTAMSSIENRIITSADGKISIDIWGAPTLSTPDKLISPRPLGPTHILVAYATAPSAIVSPSNGKNTLPRRRPSTNMTYPQTVELPINDLLFTLNVPNLSSPVLPRRLQRELPRVLMQVPHLETFPELVVYLHTKNQAELFRRVIPEWVRDLMHPLPTQLGAGAVGSVASLTPETMGQAKKKRSHRQLFSMLVLGSSASASLESLSPSLSTSSLNPCPVDPERTIDNIAKEIAEASYCISSMPLPASPENMDLDPLVHTAVLLDALRDNLEYVGFLGRGVWNELDISREILIKAMCWKARIGDEGERE